ncbi:MAG: type IV pilus biogenesis/stability protein PilW [Gammaproteobacteria bacterium]
MRPLILPLLLSVALAGCVTEGGQEKPKPSAKEASSANLNLGAAYLRQGDIESAVSKLQKAVDLDDRNTQAHATLALAYERMGLDKEADTHYQRAVRNSKNDAVIENMYGAYLCRNERFTEAQPYLLRAARNPRYRTPEAAYVNAGICAVRDQRLEEAEEFFRSALRIKPRHGDALWQMASLSYERDRDLQARAFIERLQAVTKLPSNVLLLAHRVESRLGNGKAATEYAQELMNNFPESREAAELVELRRNGG